MLCGEITESASEPALTANVETILLSASPAPDSNLPASFDWRNKDSRDWTTPIKNQGRCGSCVAHAALAAFESVLEIANNQPDSNPDLSEQTLFFCGCDQCCRRGWYLDKAAEFLRDTGVPDETCWIYSPADIKCEGYCADREARVKKAATFHRLASPQEMKQSLVQNGPLLGRMDVYLDFFYY